MVNRKSLSLYVFDIHTLLNFRIRSCKMFGFFLQIFSRSAKALQILREQRKFIAFKRDNKLQCVSKLDSMEKTLTESGYSVPLLQNIKINVELTDKIL